MSTKPAALAHSEQQTTRVTILRPAYLAVAVLILAAVLALGHVSYWAAFAAALGVLVACLIRRSAQIEAEKARRMTPDELEQQARDDAW